MIPLPVNELVIIYRFPRVSGDDPSSVRVIVEVRRFSPRERG